MDISRILKHLFFLDWQVHRAFPPATLDAIEQAIHANEQNHLGEICFVVEGGLEGQPLWSGQSSRERAIDVFHSCGCGTRNTTVASLCTFSWLTGPWKLLLIEAFMRARATNPGAPFAAIWSLPFQGPTFSPAL